MRKRFPVGGVVFGIVLLIAYGIWNYAKLPGPGIASNGLSSSYGAPVQSAEPPLSIDEAVAFAERNPDANVTIEGQVIDQGPTMGCWVRLRDASGTLFVQTDPMVYMPQELRGQTVRASGSFVREPFYGMGYHGSHEPAWILLTPGINVVRRTS